MTDTYWGETSWELVDTLGNILAVSSLYSEEGETVITEVCVPNGTVVLSRNLKRILLIYIRNVLMMN